VGVRVGSGGSGVARVSVVVRVSEGVAVGRTRVLLGVGETDGAAVTVMVRVGMEVVVRVGVEVVVRIGVEVVVRVGVEKVVVAVVVGDGSRVKLAGGFARAAASKARRRASSCDPPCGL
jgi:hypothetical protein